MSWSRFSGPSWPFARERDELVSRDAVRIAVFSWARQERDSWLAQCRAVEMMTAVIISTALHNLLKSRAIHGRTS